MRGDVHAIVAYAIGLGLLLAHALSLSIKARKVARRERARDAERAHLAVEIKSRPSG